MSKPTKMQGFIRHLEETCGLDDKAGILDAVRALPRQAVNDMAVRWVLLCISKMDRRENRAVERESNYSEMHESVKSGAASRPTSNDEGRHAETEAAYARVERRMQKAYEERSAKIREKLNSTMEALKFEMKVQWTQELLDATFNLSDGTAVTWGEATAEQHQERIAMFKNNAAANLEGAARHELALERLQAAGASKLKDVA